MQVFNNIKNFLYDQDYFISVFKDNIYIFNYNELAHLSKEKILLNFSNFSLSILGENLIIQKMTKKELLIKGIVNSLELIR